MKKSVLFLSGIILFVMLAASLIAVADQPPPAALLPFSVHVTLDSLAEESDWSYIPAFTNVADFNCDVDATVSESGENADVRVIVDSANEYWNFEINSTQSYYAWDFLDSGESYGTASLEWTGTSNGAETASAYLNIYCTVHPGE